MKKLSILFLILWGVGVKGQSTSNGTPNIGINNGPLNIGSMLNLQTPNTASLGVYGEIPISYFTGTPTINIPLLEIPFEQKTLPISLSYHSAGILPDQHPGWVGLGWTLNAGGCIYRIVKDCADDYIWPGTYGRKSGYYFTHDLLNTPDWDKHSFLMDVAKTDKCFYNDTEPDVFCFSFFGINGKFYLSEQGKWQVQCDKHFNVEYNGELIDVPIGAHGTNYAGAGYSKVFAGFTLVADDGTRYVFGRDKNAIEFSIGFFQQYDDVWTANAWYLTQIISPTGRKMTFSYERGDYINQMFNSVYEDIYSGLTKKNKEICSNSSFHDIDYWYDGKLLSPVYLTEISYSQGSIGFAREVSNELRYEDRVYKWRYKDWHSGGGQGFLPILDRLPQVGYPQCLSRLNWYKLSGIVVRNNENDALKTIGFQYNDNPNQRLTLMKVRSASGDYLFEYDHLDQLPPYLSNEVDHWGYYNATKVNLMHSSLYMESRKPNSTVLNYGLLSKITYPTKGYTKFIFEPHDYRKQLKDNRWEGCDSMFTKNQVAGGIRIKKIINSSTGNVKDEVVSKEFFYTSDYVKARHRSSISSGVLAGKIQYLFDLYQIKSVADTNITLTTRFLRSNSILPVSNASGNHIGYTNVTEKFNDGSFIYYTFSNFDNGYVDEPCVTTIRSQRTPYDTYVSKEQDRGLLKSKESYNSNGRLLSTQEISYTRDRKIDSYVKAMIAFQNFACDNFGALFLEGSTYKNYTYTMLPSEIIDKIYTSDSKILSTTTRYSYRNNLVTEKCITDSKGAEIKELIRYPHDIPGKNIYVDMVNKGMVAYPVEQLTLRNGNVIKGTLTEYKHEGPNLLVPAAVYAYHSIDLKSLANFHLYDGWKREGRYTQEPVNSYQRYDSYGNILEYVGQDGMVTCILWSYDGSYPIAIIKNATWNTITSVLGGEEKVQGFSKLMNPSLEDIKDFLSPLFTSTSLSSAEITYYSFSPLIGMLSMTAPNGITTYYEYDCQGQAKIARLLNVRDHNKNFVERYHYNYKQ